MFKNEINTEDPDMDMDIDSDIDSDIDYDIDSDIDLDTDTNIDDKYSFLGINNNPLSQIFSNNTTNHYNIHLCIYKINLECKKPFLEYLLNTVEKNFPNILDFQFPTFPENENDDENTYFVNKCLTEIIKILQIEKIFSIEISKKMYKGFIEYDENNIFIVFECLPEFNFFQSPNLQWLILDEILYKVNTVNPITQSFFKKHEFMNELYTTKESIETFPLPILLYMYSDNEYSIIDERIRISWLGYNYYFTNDSKTQKYAVFIEKSKYILKEISSVTKEEQTIFINNNINENVVTIYFHQGNTQFWCVKNNNNFARV
jgi:hypothetical protein